MSTSPLTHKLQRERVHQSCVICCFSRTHSAKHLCMNWGAELSPSLWTSGNSMEPQAGKSFLLEKRLKQKVSILSLPNLPNVNVPRSYSRLGRAQASARSWGGGCSLGRSSLHQGSQAQAPRGFRDLVSPLLSISLHSLLTSHTAAVVSREQGPLCSRKLPIVAGVSCPLLAPPAR